MSPPPECLAGSCDDSLSDDFDDDGDFESEGTSETDPALPNNVTGDSHDPNSEPSRAPVPSFLPGPSRENSTALSPPPRQSLADYFRRAPSWATRGNHPGRRGRKAQQWQWDSSSSCGSEDYVAPRARRKRKAEQTTCDRKKKQYRSQGPDFDKMSPPEMHKYVQWWRKMHAMTWRGNSSHLSLQRTLLGKAAPMTPPQSLRSIPFGTSSTGPGAIANVLGARPPGLPRGPAALVAPPRGEPMLMPKAAVAVPGPAAALSLAPAGMPRLQPDIEADEEDDEMLQEALRLSLSQSVPSDCA